MSLVQLIWRIFKEIGLLPYYLLDALYVGWDRLLVRRTRNISRIPRGLNRRGGKRSYAEWAHVVGIFQTLMRPHTPEDPTVLDIGCGTGLLAIAAEPLLGERGRYVGMDVMTREVKFCRGHYPPPMFDFIHFDVSNAAYAPGQAHTKAPWPLEDNTFDLATALSVWTHLNEEDATFYFAEIARVLKPGGKAIVTFFLLDDAYHNSLPRRSPQKGRYHRGRQDQWVFDQPSYGSDAWFHPKHVRVPENAIALTGEGLQRLLAASGLRLIEEHTGNWKETPGTYFQDVLIFQKD